MKKRLKDVGEWSLINLIRRKSPASKKALVGIGDDAAVYECQSNLIVLTTDTFVEGVHFSLSYFTPQDVGYRALAATLSDIAAMAASPVAFLVSLGLPKSFEVDLVEGVYEGFNELASRYEVELWGGDIVTSPLFFLSLTAFGEVERSQLRLRSSAKAGQLVAVTGYLGLSEAGRLVLQKGLKNNRHQKLIEKHLRPQPRINEAQVIGRHISGAMEDTSDGLLVELKHIGEESKVGIVVDASKVPVEKSLKEIAEEFSTEPLELALSGGEDFELVFTAFPDEIEKVESEAKNLKLKLSVIGEVIEEQGVFLRKDKEIEEVQRFGYEHFKEL